MDSPHSTTDLWFELGVVVSKKDNSSKICCNLFVTKKLLPTGKNSNMLFVKDYARRVNLIDYFVY